MKRVFVVLEAWGKGGTETYVAGLVKKLLRHKFDVDIILLRKGNEVEISFLPQDRVQLIPLTRLWSFIKNENPDILSLHLYTNLLPVTLIARVAKKKPIVTLHRTIDSWGWRHRLYWKIAIQMSALSIGVSKLLVDQITSRKLLEYPISGGVDSAFFSAVRTNLLESEYYKIIAVGRHSPEKDWEVLVKAVSSLPAKVKNHVVIDFYGAGKQTEQLETQARRECLHANFNGHVDKMGLITAFSEAHLSVLPSRFEGLPISAIEGMAIGVPTIVANFASAGEFVDHNKNGHIFPVGDFLILAKLIEWHYYNFKESCALGMQGKQDIFNKYSEDMVYSQYLSLFNNNK